MRHVMSVVIVLLLATVTGFAQESEPAGSVDTGWELSANVNLTSTQNAYSDNWAEDEYGSMTWTFSFNALAERQLSRKVNTRNTLKMSFGQTHNQQPDRAWLEPTKSTDLIDFESLWRYTYGGWVDPYLAGRFQSQFYTVDHTGNEMYFNPMTFTESAGVARTLMKEETREWIVRLGFGFRQQLNRDSLLNATTMEYGSETANDGGFEFVSELTTPLVEERLHVTSKLTVFQAIFYSKADDFKGTPQEDYWQSPDVNLETIFTANITKYIMVNLYTQLLYDKEVALGGRFKETLSMGLTYTLF